MLDIELPPKFRLVNVISVSVSVQKEDAHTDLEFWTKSISNDDHTEKFGRLKFVYRCENVHICVRLTETLKTMTIGDSVALSIRACRTCSRSLYSSR